MGSHVGLASLRITLTDRFSHDAILLSVDEQTCKQDHTKYQRARYEQTSAHPARAECE
jgi:hypothetical protein